jgi:hypothetical protein
MHVGSGSHIHCECVQCVYKVCLRKNHFPLYIYIYIVNMKIAAFLASIILCQRRLQTQ